MAATKAASIDSHLGDNVDLKKSRIGSRKGEPMALEAGAHSVESVDDDGAELEALGYVPSFKREFSNLATVSSSSLSCGHAF